MMYAFVRENGTVDFRLPVKRPRSLSCHESSRYQRVNINPRLPTAGSYSGIGVVSKENTIVAVYRMTKWQWMHDGHGTGTNDW